ncbi:porin family protein [Fulvivirgaceae bacterium BMA10]|uniref:Porin family protein n=1 Tax=Splendidivirga corallicola TaxID=3051826 RepID=A0ABT8KX33_9BACT|nr:porin family protein [Fulvivirgaceae bacterium BMA10]
MHHTYAQDCEVALEKAEKSYADGHLRQVPVILKDCLKKGFRRDQQERSYKLLVQTYLFLDDMEQAETYLLKLLRSNPLFTVSALDPPELVHLYNKFRTYPVFSLYAKGGLNTSHINSLNLVGVDHALFSVETSKASIGFQVGSGVDFRLFKNFDLRAEFIFSNKKFEITNPLITTSYNRDLSSHNYTTIKLKEKQFWVDIPLAIKYTLHLKKIDPFVYVGASFNYLLSANLDISRVNANPLDVETPQRPVDGPAIDLDKADLRKNMHFGMLAGVGLKYEIGTDYIFFDLRYERGFTNLRNADAPLNANNDLLFRYGYIDNDFSLESFSFSIGYARYFYDPKKLRKKKKALEKK